MSKKIFDIVYLIFFFSYIFSIPPLTNRFFVILSFSLILSSYSSFFLFLFLSFFSIQEYVIKKFTMVSRNNSAITRVHFYDLTYKIPATLHTIAAIATMKETKVKNPAGVESKYNTAAGSLKEESHV